MDLDSQELGIVSDTCHGKIDERWNEGTSWVQSLEKRLAMEEEASKRFNNSLDRLVKKLEREQNTLPKKLRRNKCK